MIPLFVYEDDLETGDPLDSNASKHKLGAVYTSIPCFPPQIASHLHKIIVTALFIADHRKEFRNHKVFHHLILELNQLKKNAFLSMLIVKVIRFFFN